MIASKARRPSSNNPFDEPTALSHESARIVASSLGLCKRNPIAMDQVEDNKIIVDDDDENDLHDVMDQSDPSLRRSPWSRSYGRPSIGTRLIARYRPNESTRSIESDRNNPWNTKHGIPCHYSLSDPADYDTHSRKGRTHIATSSDTIQSMTNDRSMGTISSK